MVSKSIKVVVDMGREDRPVAQLVQRASQFESEIHFEIDGMNVNAKSIMGMMCLGLDQRLEVKVTADGKDEGEAVKELKAFLEDK